MVLQDIYFKRALEEEGIPISGFRTWHDIPKCSNNCVEYGLIFPKSFLNEIKEFKNKHKIGDYFFIGTLTGEHRQFLKKWDKPNSLIKSTSQNNFIHPNNDTCDYYGDNYFNKPYFNEMSNYKFVLTPDGCSAHDEIYKNTNRFLWTYRFYESIMSYSIPVLNNDVEIYSGYKYYTLDDEHIYREDWCEHNFNKLKKENFIWKIED